MQSVWPECRWYRKRQVSGKRAESSLNPFCSFENMDFVLKEDRNGVTSMIVILLLRRGNWQGGEGSLGDRAKLEMTIS